MPVVTTTAPDGRIDALKEEIKKLHQLISHHYSGIGGVGALITVPLMADAAAGSTRVEVPNPRMFPPGSVIRIGDESRIVVGYGSPLLDRPLEHNHSGGEKVVLVERSPLTPEEQHAFYQATRADETEREQARMDEHMLPLQVPVRGVRNKEEERVAAAAAPVTPTHPRIFAQTEEPPADAREEERVAAAAAPVTPIHPRIFAQPDVTYEELDAPPPPPEPYFTFERPYSSPAPQGIRLLIPNNQRSRRSVSPLLERLRQGQPQRRKTNFSQDGTVAHLLSGRSVGEGDSESDEETDFEGGAYKKNQKKYVRYVTRLNQGKLSHSRFQKKIAKLYR